MSKSRHTTPPAFGSLPGFDFEPLREAVIAGATIDARNELFVLWEEGHAPVALLELLREIALEAGLIETLPALVSARQLLAELPLDEQVLPLFQVLELICAASAEDEGELTTQDEVITPVTHTSLSDLFSEWMTRDTRSNASFEAAWVAVWRERFQPELAVEALTSALAQQPNSSLHAWRLIAAMQDTGRSWSLDEFPPQIAQCIVAIREETACELTHCENDVALSFIIAELDDALCRLEDVTLALEVVELRLTAGALAQLPQAALRPVIGAIAAYWHALKIRLPLRAQTDAAQLPEALELNDLAIFVERSKPNAAVKFAQQWNAAGGDADPVKGLLTRCAVRADANKQGALGLELASQMTREFRSDHSPQRNARWIALAGALAMLPKAYQIVRWVVEDSVD